MSWPLALGPKGNPKSKGFVCLCVSAGASECVRVSVHVGAGEGVDVGVGELSFLSRPFPNC